MQRDSYQRLVLSVTDRNRIASMEESGSSFVGREFALASQKLSSKIGACHVAKAQYSFRKYYKNF
jgi:translation initiation factor 2B subunit (eIF-2B alpha/beta/delta family)